VPSVTNLTTGLPVTVTVARRAGRGFAMALVVFLLLVLVGVILTAFLSSS
jgi:hypothetical protein